MITVAIVILFIGIALGIYAVIAPRPPIEVPVQRTHVDVAPLQATTKWTDETSQEFARLSDGARCDLVFAVAALDDERSTQLLTIALEDPSEGVALAAAHALTGSGRAAVLERFLARNPGERAEHIVSTLSLLTVPSKEESVAAGP